MKNRQWLLARRPQGMISADDFTWTETPVPSPAEGEVLVRNQWLSCDPTQRGWIAGDTYLPAVKIGDARALVRGRNGGRIASPEVQDRPARAGPLRLAGLFLPAAGNDFRSCA